MPFFPQFSNLFVPPVGPDSNVSLLLHMNGANNSTSFIDSSLNNFTITAVGDAEISTSQSKYGGSSGYFNGTNSKINTPTNVKFAFGSGNFTIEMWVYPLEQLSGTDRLIGNLNSGYSQNDWTITSSDSGGVEAWALYSSNLGVVLNPVNKPQQEVWSHLAYTRSGDVFRVFVNGQTEDTNTNSDSIDSGTSEYISIGSSGNGQEWYNGYIDDLRIVKGEAIYTSDFTPPTSQLPDP